MNIMKNIMIIIVAALMCGVSYGQGSQRERLEKHLYTLASDSLRGRAAGTEDGQKAADYIEREWKKMGLKSMAGDSNYRMPFSRTSVQRGKGEYCNLVAFIEGSDPTMKHEYIVVGAHYDHVGVMGDKIYNGADDNASGSSCVLEMARQLLAKRSQLKRSVVICAYDAEEVGLYGSTAHVNHLKNSFQLSQVKLMMSVDMVGWYKADGELTLEGVGTIADGKDLVDPKALGVDIKVRTKKYETSMLTATDTEPYAVKGIPTLAVTTGLKSPYHKPEDDAELIDYEGLDRVTDYLVALTIAASQKEGVLASGHVARKHRDLKGFEIGLAAGLGSSNLNFPEATVDGKSALGFSGGLMVQYNFSRYIGLRLNAMYNYSHCPLPASGDAYGKGYGVEQHSLLVPLTLQLGVRESGTGIYFGFGFFYQHVFDGGFYGDIPAGEPAYEVEKNPGGIAWNIGMRLGHWQLDGTWYYQLSDFFETANGLPKAHMNMYAVTIGYFF